MPRYSAFQTQTAAEIAEDFRADLKATIADADVSGPGADFFDMSEAAGRTMHRQQDYALNRLRREAFPQSASFEALIEHASPLIGAPHDALPAEGTATATGTNGSTWTAGLYLVNRETGIRFITTLPGVIAGGEGAVHFEGAEGGDNTNMPVGTTLYWEAPPSGLGQAVVIDADMEGGSDAEARDAYLERYLEWLRNPDAGGREKDYEKWAKQTEGVGYAKAFPARRGLGTCDVAILDPERELVSGAVKAAAQANIDAARPTTAKDPGAVYAVDPVLTEIDLVFAVRLDAAQGWSATPSTQVWEGTSKNRIVVVDIAGYAVGQYVAILELGEARKIAAIETPAALVFEREFSRVPEQGEHVIPGCPVYDALYQAVRAYFNTLDSGDEYLRGGAEQSIGNIPWVIAKEQTSPAGDVAAVVTEFKIEALTMGTVRFYKP